MVPYQFYSSGYATEWIQNKLHSVAKIMHLSRIGQRHQARNINDANTSTLRSDTIAHLQNQILRVVCVCGVVPLVIIGVVEIQMMPTLLL